MPTVRLYWPHYLVTVATAFPLVGAWSARRLTWGDPVGQLGLAWGALFALSFVQVAGALSGHFGFMRGGTAAATLLTPLLLVPPLLTWIGPGAARWRTPLLAFFALTGIGALLAFGSGGRNLGLVFRAPSMLVLAALALAMLVAQARRAADPQGAPAEAGWLWIGGGLLVYSLVTVVGRPMVEFLLLQFGPSASRDVSMSMRLVYSATLLGITWGLWKGRRPHAGSPAARIAA